MAATAPASVVRPPIPISRSVTPKPEPERRELPEAVHHTCGKWTRVTPCWSCGKPAAPR